MTVIIPTVATLESVAASFHDRLKPGMICFLQGPMGVGKTTFVSAFLRGMGYTDVSSPSYALVHEYDAAIPVFHIDLYRLSPGAAVDQLDLSYYFRPTHLVFIEWPERLGDCDFEYVTLRFSRQSDGSRALHFESE